MIIHTFAAIVMAKIIPTVIAASWPMPAVDNDPKKFFQ
jgi:hypothetical protein